MAKVMVMYPQPTDKEGFNQHYKEVHMPLAQKVQGVQDASIEYVQQTQNVDQDLYQVVSISFASMESLQSALQSDEWKEVEGDLGNLMQYLSETPSIIITD
ncbi:EthD family reductase [Pontibacillus salicampi]|uniref:EthD family reductase n=1 Tax=Pontibacillus salicampi TaxID=1449801 RepID=A0ABV6LPE9_9BACI